MSAGQSPPLGVRYHPDRLCIWCRPRVTLRIILRRAGCMRRSSKTEAELQTSPIHITRWGSTGCRVVLVHGSAQGSQTGGDSHFSAQQALAAEGFQLIVPDRPGHGRSPSRGLPDDAALDGAWVADLMGDAAHLVGHSFGACVVLEAAARRPRAVLSVTLIEPALQKLALNLPSVRRFSLQILAVKWLSLSATSRARRFARLAGIPAEIGGARSEEELRRMGQGIARLQLPAPATMKSQLQTLRDAGIPLLVVTGGWSEAIDGTGAVAAQLGGGQHHIVEAPHHFPNLLADAFNPLLLTFMRESEMARRR